MTAALGIIHGLDYLFSHWLIGSIFFNYLILPAGGIQALEIDKNRFQNLLVPTLLSSLSWMIFSAYGMTESWAPNEMWTAMSETQFGHLWCVRIVLLVVVFLGFKKNKNHRLAPLLLISFSIILPLFSITTGHAASQTDSIALRVALDLIHSLAVATWTGGLWSLIIWLQRRMLFSKISPDVSFRLVKRFSHFAVASTAVIGITGVAMGLLNGASWKDPLATDYGKLLSLKLALFLTTLGIASINQFIHLKKWNHGNESQFSLGVYRESRLELIIIVIIFGVAGFLARTALPGEM